MADAPPDPAAHRLSDEKVREQLIRLNRLLEQVEQIPGPSGELALEAVSALAAVYGEALARVVEHTATHADVRAALVGDELVGHLLVLHGVHPDPVETRVARVIEQLRPAVRSRGGEVELVGIESGGPDGPAAVVRLRTRGCGGSATGIEADVREAVLAQAPELTDVRWASDPRPATFVPVDAVLSRPAGARP